MAAWTWGFGKYGQLGNGQTSSAETPQLLILPRHTLPLQVSCGAHFTLTLCRVPRKDGVDHVTKLFACGLGKYGRLGTGSEEDHHVPAEVIFLDKDIHVSQVSAGHWHSCCITSDGQLYAWGYHKTHGVLGVLSPEPFLAVPTKVPGLKFKLVSCGYNFTYAVSVDGSCWAWGSGTHGVLGSGDTNDRHQPTLVSVPGGACVKEVGCGYCHAAVVTEEGMLLTVGYGGDGALGLGKSSKTDKSELQCVDMLPAVGVVSVSCSLGEHHGHTLACTGDGEVYSWGDGYKGKLGLGDQLSRDLPTQIDPHAFNGESMIQVSCGGIHSAAVSKEGCVFTWGCGSDGRLGHPEAKGHRYLFRSDIPRKVENLSDFVTVVNSSYYHTAVSTGRN